MFTRTFKGSMAAASGMLLAGAVLVAPGAVAAPTTGRVASWGANGDGQLGNETYTDSGVPVDTSGVLAGKTITAMDAGWYHTCAVANGKAYCWGANGYGQLGDGSTNHSNVPVPVNTYGVLAGKTITAISAGYGHTCALADGKSYCWGYNYHGSLGNNSNTESKVPVAVDTSGVLAGKTITAISAGGEHTCALAGGKAYCWGRNSSLQLGNLTPTTSSVPVPVDTSGVLAGKTLTAMDAGDNHTCALAGGKAYCWGGNFWGQLGASTGPTNTKLPIAVDTSGVLAGKTITAISAGGLHTCAVANGKASCWGRNSHGQLGNNSTIDSKVPVAVDTSGVLAGKTLTAISGGGTHTCAVADGKASCWGYNDHAQLGNGSTIDSKVPVPVDTSGVLAGKTVTAISAGGGHTAALFAAVPQPPTGVAGMAGDAKVMVFWTAPGDDGGSPVSEYVATAIPGGSTCTTSGTSCVVPGLASGTSYTFTVTARNDVGVSAPSAPSVPVTPAETATLPPVTPPPVTPPPVTPSPVAPPPAPVTPPSPQVKPVGPLVQPPSKVTGVKAILHKGTVRITWKAVARTNSYRVRITKPGGTAYKAWKTTGKRVFTAKLRKGAKYRFQVVAVGAGGRGPALTIRLKGK